MSKAKSKNLRARRRTESLDLVAVQESAVQESIERQADAVLAFTGSGVVPDFISDAVIDAIEEAAQRTGFPAPTYAPEEKDTRRKLVDLFSQTRHLSLRAQQNTREELARALSAVLNHPDTPSSLFNAVGRELTELLTPDWTLPEMIERALDDDARVRQEGMMHHV